MGITEGFLPFYQVPTEILILLEQYTDIKIADFTNLYLISVSFDLIHFWKRERD